MLNKESHVLGYNRQEVDAFLQQLTDQYRAEKTGLQSRVAEATAEIARLGQERQKLESELKRRSGERRLLLLATEQFEQARQALRQAMQNQVEQERAALRERLAQAELQCLALDRQMSVLQRQIDALLQSFVAVVGDERTETKAQPAIRTEISLAAATPSAEAGRPIAEQGRQISFWDQELESLIAQTGNEPQPKSTQEVTAAAVAVTEGRSAAKPAATAVQPEEPAATQTSPKSTPAGASSASPAVATEIRNVRHRYIVGKVAGEDLRDDQGKLIVAKGGTISAEIVTEAEACGRLPELIINMQLPDQNGR